MDRPITHLVINWIHFEENMISVGATDNERWRWDTEEGMSGADAKTLVYVSLEEHGANYAVSETAGFHASPGDPTRSLAMSHLIELFEIAWAIKNEKLDFDEARKKYFGMEIKK